MAVGYYVPTVSAADDEDLPHLVMRKFSLVSLHITVARFQYHVAVLAIVDGFENCFVPFIYPVLSHDSYGAPWRKEV